MRRFLLLATLGLTVVPVAGTRSQPTTPGGECRDMLACRELALAAAERGEYETFHDLAWRAVQKGPPRDPDLMYLLARAQSLSGRPHDALVTLRRLAEMGIASDAAGDDFRRTRALPAWPEVEASIARVRLGAKPKEEVKALRSPPPAVSEVGPRAPAASEAGPSTAAHPDTGTRIVPSFESHTDAGTRILPSFVPAGLAYDAVSRRFVIGNRDERKLMVVGEGSDHAVAFAGTSAGLLDIMAFEIERSQGFLWVVTTGTRETGERASVLHKMQLVSGRLLQVMHAPDETLPVKFVDVAVARTGEVFVLDQAGQRLFSVRPKRGALEPVVKISAEAPSSIALASEQILYVAHANGLIRVDVRARTASTVRPSPNVDLRGLERIRWHRGALVATQSAADGTRAIIRLRMARSGRTILKAETIDAFVAPALAVFWTLFGDELIYFAQPASASDRPGANGIEATVRRVRLR